MRLEVNIGSLVLEGFAVPPHHQAALKGAVEAELTRLFSDGAPPPWRTHRRIPRLQGGTLPPAKSADPAHLGRAIARAVYAGFAPQTGPGPA